MSEKLLRLEQIVKLRKCGLTYREIGLRFGITLERVRQIINPEMYKRPVRPAMPQHPLFIKYKRDWLHEVTGYSKGYLCRVAKGVQPMSRSFIDRVCLKFNQPESALFTKDNGYGHGYRNGYRNGYRKL